MPIPGNLFTLPDVPLPKMKDLLSIVARPPQRSPRIQNGRSQTYLSYDSEQTTPITEDKHFVDGQDQDERYESLPDQKVQDRLTPSPPPPPAAIEEDDHFGLADQIRGTPERSMKGGKKKKNNRRSHEIHDDMPVDSEEIPPPLPPKKLSPSPKKGLSLEAHPSVDEEEIEAIPVKVTISLLISIATHHLCKLQNSSARRLWQTYS